MSETEETLSASMHVQSSSAPIEATGEMGAATESTLKRKASPSESRVGEGSPKRTRVESDDTEDQATSANPPAPAEPSSTAAEQTTTTASSHTSPPARDSALSRARARQDERGRASRLFGSLRTALSQTGTTPHQKRRQEIERRQHDRLEKQRAEEERNFRARSAKLIQTRMREQIVFEERVMETKHKMLLDLAHSLATVAEPRIYYRPWKLTRSQESKIESQILEAKAQVRREVEDFEDRKEEHIRLYGQSKKLKQPSDIVNTDHDGDRDMDQEEKQYELNQGGGGEDMPEDEKDKGQEESAEEHRHQRKSSEISGSHSMHDESGDVVVGEGEDMVIY